MMRLLQKLFGSRIPRHIATVRHGEAKMVICALMPQTAANAHQRPPVRQGEEMPCSTLTCPVALPGLRFVVRWPSRDETLGLGMALQTNRGDGELWAMLLTHLCDLPAATAKRLVLAHPDTVAGIFATAFQRMRAQLPEGDPRLNDRLPAVLAAEAA